MHDTDSGNASRAIANRHLRRLASVVAACDERLPHSDVVLFNESSLTAAAWATREQIVLDPYVATEASDVACVAIRTIFDSVASLGEIIYD